MDKKLLLELIALDARAQDDALYEIALGVQSRHLVDRI